MMALVVGVEAPQQAEVLDFLRQSDAYSASLYPVEGRRPLGVEALSAPEVHFLFARLDGVAVGCCALIELNDGTGELKRMIVDEQARQQGVGLALLRAVETIALKSRVDLNRNLVPRAWNDRAVEAQLGDLAHETFCFLFGGRLG